MPRNSKKARNRKVMGRYNMTGMSESKIKKLLSNTKQIHVLRTKNAQYIVTDNLLRNFTSRDIVPVSKSFDEIHAAKLTEIDALFSETAFLLFVAHQGETQTEDKYKPVLAGLLQNAMNTFGGAVVLLRSGLPGQSMVLLRQVVELCSTIIHICGDPKAKAIDNFIEGNYQSTASIGQAKKAVPIIGHFWGFLSTSFVHITYNHSEIKPVRLHKKNDDDVEAIIKCLRMTVWICYLTAEIAFPSARENNRYWMRRVIDGKSAVEYAPSPEERDWAAKFLDLDDVGPDDLDGRNSTSVDA